jgi:hypothetical protein
MRAYGRFAAAGPRRARVGAVPAVIAGTQGQRVLAGGWGASVSTLSIYRPPISQFYPKWNNPPCVHVVATSSPASSPLIEAGIWSLGAGPRE